MFRRAISIAAASAALAGAGCSGISSDSTLQEVLDASGLASMTVGDVLGTIETYSGKAATLPLGEALTAEQESALSELRAQLDAGTLTQEAFIAQVAETVGVSLRGGGHGPRRGGRGPLGMGGGGPGAALDLSEDQQAQARTIFEAMQTDVQGLRDAARTAIEGLLTQEQAAQLEDADTGLGRGCGLRLMRPGFDATALAEQLSLSAEQQTQVQTIIDALRGDVQARREQAESEFRAILTEEQQVEFDARIAERQTHEAAAITE